MFVVIYEHEITSAYLYLDERKCVEHTINLDYLERMEYESNYPNGYGGHLSRLRLFIKEGQEIVLYREDADKAFETRKMPLERGTRMITYKGKPQYLAAWCKELGVNYQTAYARLNKYHWPIEKVFNYNGSNGNE